MRTATPEVRAQCLRARSLRVLFAASLAISLAAAAAGQAVSAKVDGKAETIGNLEAKVASTSQALPQKVGGLDLKALEYGYFTFKEPWGKLDTKCDFRWFQTINVDGAPLKAFNGKVTGVPYVDPPFDGYEYQKTPDGKPGADQSPFYENDTGFAGAYPANPNGFFAFNDTHKEGEWSLTFDSPNTGNNEKLEFWTFLVGFGEGIAKATGSATTMDLLIGYEWTYEKDGTGKVTAALTKMVDVSAAATQTKLSDALAGGFFDNKTWKVTTGTDYGGCVPEPASLVLLALGALALVRRRAH